MANTYLTRTPSSSGNRNKWTFSGWVKRSQTSAEEVMFSCYQSNDYYTFLRFEADGTIKFRDNYTGSANLNLDTSAKYRDTSAWYHVVAVYDKDNSTSTNKAILYINGERVTSFSTATYPSNASTWNVDNVSKHIGSLNTGQYWNGSMSHIHFSDGYALAPTVFGSTDSTTGEWKINTSPSFTLGTNGFSILKDGNTITDQSTNSNHFSLGGGTLTTTLDCPSNVFCVLNPLSTVSGMTLGAGSTTCQSDTTWRSTMSTLAVSSGKWYWEAKVLSLGTINFGITLSKQDGTTHSNVDLGRIMYSSNGAVNRDILGDSVSASATFGASDIIGISLDCDNGILKFYKNDSLMHTTTSSVISSNEWTPANGVNNAHGAMNFGNGYFNATAIASEGTNASGIGIFEYDVKPTDATAISTKGLNL